MVRVRAKLLIFLILVQHWSFALAFLSIAKGGETAQAVHAWH